MSKRTSKPSKKLSIVKSMDPLASAPRLNEIQVLKLKNCFSSRLAAQRQIELCRRVHAETVAQIPEEIRKQLAALEQEMANQTQALQKIGAEYDKVRVEVKDAIGIDIHEYSFDDVTGICWKVDEPVPDAVKIANGMPLDEPKAEAVAEAK